MSLIQTTALYKQFMEFSQSENRIGVWQGGTRCFTGETLVQTKQGHKCIKDILQGEEVLSLDETTQTLVFNKVLDKFIYECDHTLISIKLKNGNIITSTYDHEYYYQGQWIRAIDIIKRKLDLCKGNKRKVYGKRFRETKGDELQTSKLSKNNETKPYSELYENNDFSEWEIQNCRNTSFSRRTLYRKTQAQSRSKSYLRDNNGQLSNKFGVGNSSRKCKTLFQTRTSTTSKRVKKWYGKTNRATSKRNKRKIQAKSIYGKNFSSRVQSKFSSNKRYSLQEEDLEAHQINLDEIIDFKIFKSNQIVYDICVDNVKNYCVTKDNIIVHNSGKTYNIVLGWIALLTKENNKTLTVCRETMVSLKNTVYRDFIEILTKTGLFDINNLSKGDMTYKLGTCLIEFRNLDDDQKIRGAKRDYLYINEANEIPFPIFKQLLFRTKKKVVLDYNPSDEFHWIYDNVLTREDCKFHKSTYLDNPFLPLEQVKEIERLKEMDPNYWRVYGLGERGMSEASIFPNWNLCDKMPEGGVTYYGLDFGYNHPTALTKLTLLEDEAYADEQLYKTQLTGADIIDELKKLNITDNDTIYADCARPELISEIHRAGFNIHPTVKGAGSVKTGIDIMKRHKLYITKRSINLIKEVRSYKWKVDKSERILDEPVKINDDAVDSWRYAFNPLLKAPSTFSLLDDQDMDFLF